MKDKYQKFLRFCQPFEWLVGIVIEIAPVMFAFQFISKYNVQNDTAFLLGILFYMFYRPYNRTLENWRREI